MQNVLNIALDTQKKKLNFVNNIFIINNRVSSRDMFL